ncbi:Arc family DNA-binding protein [Novosphingobium sp. YJ-S2-02]|uniref:Arc family DNA-binding protein n=1 Tax=Novosphingobium aureum TaxID=2792964 RepID=A0A931HEC4_9SPHN|nr:Arc family DNA-binding protein [Novosphingobium aureum]MBH0114214.1 Arc family DNA-binding protein [Novosphingobium aureum]
MSESPKQIPPFGLRMPPGLKEQVQRAAEASNRSMNAEIVSRLENSFVAGDGAVLDIDEETVKRLIKQVIELREGDMRDRG